MIIVGMHTWRWAGPWRPLVLAAGWLLTGGAAAAAAQTVMVRNAPPGATIEVVLNAQQVSSTKADDSGGATVSASLASIGKLETDVYIYVDVCPNNLRRIVLAERGAVALPPGDCERRDVTGLFYIKRVSTLVMNIGSAVPTVLLRQGPYRPRPPRVWKPAPTGLVLFGGGAYTTFRDQSLISCGAVEGCEGKDAGFGGTAGVSIWLTRWLGAEVAYIRPRSATTEGSASGIDFNSTFDADIVAINGIGGIPAGPIRIFGKGGVNYTNSKLTTIQRLGDQSQTLLLKTKGWGWGFGGGMEAWFTERFALFGELDFNILRGDPVGDNVEGTLDDRVTAVFVGARIRIGG